MSIFKYFAADSGRIAPAVPADKVDRTYKRLRIQTFLAATFGYALYYVCRLSMGVMKQPLIDAGLLSAAQLGIITACLYWAYALGKLVNGFLADSSNIKRFMAIGLVVSVAMNFTMGIIGASASPGEAGQGNMVLCIVFCICWAINGWSQSMGAPPAIISLSRWFPLRIRGTFYGFFSASHNIGEGLSFVFVSALVAAFGWKWGFFGAALAGALGVALILLFLHNSTESKGLPSIETLAGEPQPKPVPASEQRAETRRLQKLVVKNPGVWILAAASAFMYMSRYAINEWGILFLQDAKGYELGEASLIVGINPIFGIIGTVVSGWLSDFLFKGDRKYPAFVAGVLEAIALAIFLFGGKAMWVNITAMVLFGIAIGVLISFLGGLMAIDLVPRKATGAALGIVGMSSYAAAGIMTLITGVMLTTVPASELLDEPDPVEIVAAQNLEGETDEMILDENFTEEQPAIETVEEVVGEEADIMVAETVASAQEEEAAEETPAEESTRVIHDFSRVRWFWLIAAIVSFMLPVLNWKRKQQTIE